MLRFKRTRGQDIAKTILSKLYESDLETATLMFVGPEGVGKATLSLEFAQSLVCEGKDKPCGECYGCVRFGGIKSPDIMVISDSDVALQTKDSFYEKSRVIKISQIRSMQNNLQKPPFEMRKRVVIIMNIEDANPESQNALLKILEEGSKKTVFILISSRPTFVLPTIRSRSLKIRFSPLRFETFSEIVGTDDRQLYVVSEGSPGIAKGFLRMREEFDVAVELWERHIHFEDYTAIKLSVDMFSRWKLYFLKIGYYVARKYYEETGNLDRFERIVKGLKDVETGFRKYTPERTLFLSALWNPRFSVV